MRVLIIGLLLLLPVVASAIEYPDLDKYYPLNVGNKWVYSSDLGLQTRKIELIDKESDCYAVSFENSIGINTLSCIQKRGDRIMIIIKSTLGGNLERLIPPEIILVAPLKKGSKWEYYSDNEYKIKHTVIGFVELDIKAGKFKNVLKIEKYVMNTKDKKKDWGKSYLYFAPNVGLIKEEVYGSSNKSFVLEELVDYKIVP